MTRIARILKSVVAAACAALLLTAPSGAQDAGAAPDLDTLFEALQNADPQSAAAIEERIWAEWSRSGSVAMDLLLTRGREALEDGNTKLAIEHFSALIDHAPDFAEGYNARATAYFQANKYGPSLADIRATLARNPRHFGAMSGLALILEELGSKEGALAAYREIEKLHPHREGLKEAILRLEQEIDGQEI